MASDLHDGPRGFHSEHSSCFEKRVGLRLAAEMAFLEHDSVHPCLEQIRDLRLFEDRLQRQPDLNRMCLRTEDFEFDGRSYANFRK